MEFQTEESGEVLTVWPVEIDVVMINKGSDWPSPGSIGTLETTGILFSYPAALQPPELKYFNGEKNGNNIPPQYFLTNT